MFNRRSEGRFSRRKADPDLLRDYDDMRNERKSFSILLPLTSVGMGVFLITYLIVLQFHSLSGFAKINIILGVTGVYLLTCFTLIVMWSKSGQKLRTFGLIVAYLCIIAVFSALAMFLMDVLIF